MYHAIYEHPLVHFLHYHYHIREETKMIYVGLANRMAQNMNEKVFHHFNLKLSPLFVFCQTPVQFDSTVQVSRTRS